MDAITRQNIGGRLLFEILTKQALFWYKKYIAYSFGYSRPTDQVKSSEWWPRSAISKIKINQLQVISTVPLLTNEQTLTKGHLLRADQLHYFLTFETKITLFVYYFFEEKKTEKARKREKTKGFLNTLFWIVILEPRLL